MGEADQARTQNRLVGKLLSSILALNRRGQSTLLLQSGPQTGKVDQPFRTPAERVAQREQKREAVLRAAVRMFNSQGFHATSLDDVAASLGVSKPTIYHY